MVSQKVKEVYKPMCSNVLQIVALLILTKDYIVNSGQTYIGQTS